DGSPGRTQRSIAQMSPIQTATNTGTEIRERRLAPSMEPPIAHNNSPIATRSSLAFRVKFNGFVSSMGGRYTRQKRSDCGNSHAGCVALSNHRRRPAGKWTPFGSARKPRDENQSWLQKRKNPAQGGAKSEEPSRTGTSGRMI